MSLISVAGDDLAVGVPLPWPLFDQDGNKLMAEGSILASAEQLETLLAARPLRELTWQTPADNGAAEPKSPTAALDDALAGGKESELSFRDMRLRVGDRIQIEPPPSVSPERHIVKLLGYLEGVSLLVTAPMEGGLRVPLQENDEIVARIFAGQKAFGFGAVVERVCKTPFDYLHLSFPAYVQGIAVRKSPRVRTNIIASVVRGTNDGEERQAGIIADLSADGALLRARQRLAEKGASIRLAFRVNLHNVDAYLTVGAAVRAVFTDEAGNDPMVNHGLQFEALAPNDSVILQSLIYQQMIEQPQTMA